VKRANSVEVHSNGSKGVVVGEPECVPHKVEFTAWNGDEGIVLTECEEESKGRGPGGSSVCGVGKPNITDDLGIQDLDIPHGC
jgi:hypothetical protein